MTYRYRCSNDCTRVEVQRPMRDYSVPPNGSCPVCKSSTWVRVYDVAPEGYVRGGGSASSPFPMTIKGINDKDGKPVVIKDSQQYKLELEKRDMVNMNDGYVRLGTSEHSVWDRAGFDDPPDGVDKVAAEKRYERARYVTESELASII